MIMNHSLLSYIDRIRHNTNQIALLLLLLTVAVGAYFWSTTSSRQREQGDATTTKSSSFPNPTPKSKNDVWEERRRRGIETASTQTSKEGYCPTKKKFGSSYYYAHNSKNSGGGYTDGLRMEDFTMNGPRLLSKNGMPAAHEEEEPTEKVNNTSGIESRSRSVSPMPAASGKKRKKITKYLWDDPGDASGIATLRIECLPGKSSTETVAWKDANITSASATLEGEGLTVTAISSDDMEYRLQFTKLYDRATEVRTIVKQKRLLVKIHKKRSGINLLGKSNVEAWPHPQKPTISTSGM